MKSSQANNGKVNDSKVNDSKTVAEAIEKLGNPCKLTQEEVNKILRAVGDQDCNKVNAKGNTAIKEAIIQVNPKALEFVLKRSKPNMHPQELNDAPLVLAAKYPIESKFKKQDFEKRQILSDELKILLLLIERTEYRLLSGPDKEKLAEYFGRAAHYASCYGNLYYLDYYLNHLRGIDTSRCYFFDYDKAISQTPHLKVIDYLVEKYSEKYPDRGLITAHADNMIERGDIEAFKKCLEYNRNKRLHLYREESSIERALALFYSKNKDKEMAQQFIVEFKKNNLTLKGNSLYLSESLSSIDVMKWLIKECNVPTDFLESDGNMMGFFWHYCNYYADPSSPLNGVDNYYNKKQRCNILEYAAFYKKEEVVLCLIEELQFKDFRDSLFIAVVRGCSNQVIKKLLYAYGNEILKKPNDYLSEIIKYSQVYKRDGYAVGESTTVYLQHLKMYLNNSGSFSANMEKYKKECKQDHDDLIKLIEQIEMQNFADKEREKESKIEFKRQQENMQKFKQSMLEKAQESILSNTTMRSPINPINSKVAFVPSAPPKKLSASPVVATTNLAESQKVTVVMPPSVSPFSRIAEQKNLLPVMVSSASSPFPVPVPVVKEESFAVVIAPPGGASSKEESSAEVIAPPVGPNLIANADPLGIPGLQPIKSNLFAPAQNKLPSMVDVSAAISKAEPIAVLMPSVSVASVKKERKQQEGVAGILAVSSSQVEVNQQQEQEGVSGASSSVKVRQLQEGIPDAKSDIKHQPPSLPGSVESQPAKLKYRRLSSLCVSLNSASAGVTSSTLFASSRSQAKNKASTDVFSVDNSVNDFGGPAANSNQGGINSQVEGVPDGSVIRISIPRTEIKEDKGMVQSSCRRLDSLCVSLKSETFEMSLTLSTLPQSTNTLVDVKAVEEAICSLKAMLIAGLPAENITTRRPSISKS